MVMRSNPTCIAGYQPNVRPIHHPRTRGDIRLSWKTVFRGAFPWSFRLWQKLRREDASSAQTLKAVVNGQEFYAVTNVTRAALTVWYPFIKCSCSRRSFFSLSTSASDLFWSSAYFEHAFRQEKTSETINNSTHGNSEPLIIALHGKYV